MPRPALTHHPRHQPPIRSEWLRLCGALMCGLLWVTLPSQAAPTVQPCHPQQATCTTAKPAPKRHRSPHRHTRAQPADPDLFVARPVSADAPKKSKAPAKPPQRAQP